MAIARKYRRKIVVEGQLYYWVARDNHDTINLTIESAECRQGSKLLTRFSGCGICGTVRPIVPSQVGRIILEALESGWRPQEKGPSWHWRSETGVSIQAKRIWVADFKPWAGYQWSCRWAFQAYPGRLDGWKGWQRWTPATNNQPWAVNFVRVG
jgi:hypothetical protein